MFLQDPRDLERVLPKALILIEDGPLFDCSGTSLDRHPNAQDAVPVLAIQIETARRRHAARERASRLPRPTTTTLATPCPAARRAATSARAARSEAQATRIWHSDRGRIAAERAAAGRLHAFCAPATPEASARNANPYFTMLTLARRRLPAHRSKTTELSSSHNVPLHRSLPSYLPAYCQRGSPPL